MTPDSNSLESVPHSGRSVIVSTLSPLGGNYGGIIQAFALQRVLGDLGFRAYTIDSPLRVPAHRLIARRARYLLRRALKRSPNPKPRSADEEQVARSLPREFVDSHIRTVDLLGMTKSSRREVLLQSEMILVGSDQVWRGGYANLSEQLLDYAEGFPIVKASYAASFGADEPIRYSRKILRKTRRLASEFTSISVREASGIEICRNIWGRDAVQHVDPALLLSRSTYEKLIGDYGPIQPGRAGLFSYLLDKTPAAEALAASVAADLGVRVTEFFHIPLNLPQSTRPMPAVHEWLRGFAEAEFVVTDSFHGTVFAILFNRPFITIANRERGLSRFDSLLELFNLRERLVDIDDMKEVVDLAEIDWSFVERKLAVERLRSLAYLRSLAE